MKKSIFNLLFFCFLVILASCGSESTNSNVSNTENQAVAATMKTKEQLQAEIKSAEEALYKNKDKQKKFNFDLAKAEKLVSAYDAYIQGNPNEPEIPEYLFKSAEIYRSLRNFNKSNNCYTQIISKYPDYEKAPHSLFLMGFSFENDMNKPDKAKEIYQQFLKKYPDHELKDDVQFSLNNLGKSPEEIIKEFEKRRAANAS